MTDNKNEVLELNEEQLDTVVGGAVPAACGAQKWMDTQQHRQVGYSPIVTFGDIVYGAKA